MQDRAGGLLRLLQWSFLALFDQRLVFGLADLRILVVHGAEDVAECIVATDCIVRKPTLLCFGDADGLVAQAQGLVPGARAVEIIFWWLEIISVQVDLVDVGIKLILDHF